MITCKTLYVFRLRCSHLLCFINCRLSQKYIRIYLRYS